MSWYGQVMAFRSVGSVELILAIAALLTYIRTGFSLKVILKHLRQFVQSDWFLPVFISHDKDTAWNVCTTHAPGWIGPLECRDLFLS